MVEEDKLQQTNKSISTTFVLLLTLLLIVGFFLYISYVKSENKKYPLYMSENSFDLFANQSSKNQTKLTTSVGGEVKITYDQINSFANLKFCPKDQCAVNISSGVKRCPSDKKEITYNYTTEVCVIKDKCPSQMPYAIRQNGEALDSSCDTGDGCYCLSTPQCATKIVNYFNSVGGKPGGIMESDLNYSFELAGEKTDDNIYNNLDLDITERGYQYCKLNPAYTDKIKHGCNFENTIGDQLNCRNTGILDITNDPKNITGELMTLDSVNNTFGTNIKYNGDLSKVYGLTSVDIIGVNNIDVSQIPSLGIIKIGTDSYNYNGFKKVNTDIMIENIYSFDNTNYIINGLKNNYTSSQTVTINPEYLVSYCSNPENDNVNYKNMLNCVQTTNQPCTDGVLAYNIDKGVPRNFCQATGLSLVMNENTNITNFYLTQPAYYTMSCVVGAGCDDSIDNSLCTGVSDCTNAFDSKTSKLFPAKDFSALTNVIDIAPSVYNLPYVGQLSKNTNNRYVLKNNYIPLEENDYFQSNPNTLELFLKKPVTTSGSTGLTLNTTIGITTGMTIFIDKPYTITSINEGSSITINPALTNAAVSLLHVNKPISFYNPLDILNFGRVCNISNGFNQQTFDIKDLNGAVNTIINIENYSVQFFKKFGFNGLMYNTDYSIKEGKRIFNPHYTYKVLNNGISPPYSYLQEAYNINSSAKALLLGDNNFKQKYSMYYPVWNEEYFRQECIYCSPSLHVIPYINKGGLSGYNIQFSGQEYYHYVPNEKNVFFHTTFGLTMLSRDNISNKSNTSYIYLNEPIPNLNIGDYILDEDSHFERGFVKPPPTTTKLHLLDNGLSIPDDKFLAYTLNKRVLSPGYNGASPGVYKNMFFGKAYLDDQNSEYYIEPKTQITSISENGKIIRTNSVKLEPIPGKKILQFISGYNSLRIGSFTDTDNLDKQTGSGLELTVNSICNGRISSLNIINRGTGYVSENLPIIHISSYLENTSAFTIGVSGN